VVPFQIDPSWYERYWLTEHPPRRRGASAERNWALIEALAEFLTVRWRRNTSSRHPVWSGAAGFRAPTLAFRAWQHRVPKQAGRRRA
jgi:hypothetical protein